VDRYVDVVVDVVGRPGPFTYRLPDGLEAGLGDEVVVPLGPRRVAGWVVATDVAAHAERSIRPVGRRRRPGPPPEVTATALAAAAWAVASPVPLLRRARRPTVRGAPELPPRPGRAVGELVDASAVAFELFVAPFDVDAASEAARLAAAGTFGRRFLVVAPTRQLAASFAERAVAAGLEPPALVPDGWDELATDRATVGVGGRYAALAPLAGPEAVVVLDPVHPSAREEASPYLEAFDVAALRSRCSGARLVVVSAVPSVALAARAARVRTSRPPASRRVRARLVRVGELDPQRGLEGLVADVLQQRRRQQPTASVLVVVPNAGLGHAPWCRSCGAQLTCAVCDAPLVVQPATRGRPATGWCARCGAVRPLRCSACGGVALRTTRWSVERLARSLAEVLREPVAPLEANARVVVGTIEALERAHANNVVVLVEPERFFGSQTLLAGELLAYWVHRALVVARRAGGSVEVVARHAPPWLEPLLGSGQVLSVLRELRTERRALGLEPLAPSAIVGGAAAAEFLHTLERLGYPNLERRELGGGRWLLEAPSALDLRRALGAVPRRWDARSLHLELDPREL